GGPAVDVGQLLLLAELERAPRHLAGKAIERAVEHVAFDEAATQPLRGVDHEGMRLAQRQESQAMIEIAVRDQDRADRRLPARARMKRREAFDLLSYLRRAVRQVPLVAVAADGHGLLGTGGGLQTAGSHPPTVRATAVPLREPAARGRAQHPDQHRCSPEATQ